MVVLGQRSDPRHARRGRTDPGRRRGGQPAGAGIYALEGDYASAALDLAAMWPAGGQAATAAKYGTKAAEKVAKEAAGPPKRCYAGGRAQGCRGSGEGAAQRGGGEGGHVRATRAACCDRTSPTPANRPHRPSRRARPVFRVGGRGSARIKGGVTENDGLVICVDGPNLDSSKEHGKIHRIYDPLELAAGVAGSRAARHRWACQAAGAFGAAGKVTGCNPLLLEAQLRAYHQAKGSARGTVVRADPARKNPDRFHQNWCRCIAAGATATIGTTMATKTVRTEPVRFQAACAIESDYVFVAAKPESLDEDQAFTRIFYFDQQTRRPGGHVDIPDFTVAGVCVAQHALWSRSQLRQHFKQWRAAYRESTGHSSERIAEAGLERSEPPIWLHQRVARNWRAALRLRWRRQIYRRDAVGWVSIAGDFAPAGGGTRSQPCAEPGRAG